MIQRFVRHFRILLLGLIPFMVGLQAAPAPTAPVTIEGWQEEVELVETSDGDLVYRLKSPDGRTEILTPLQFAKRHFQREQGRSLINRLFNITSPIGLLWVAIGLLGQALFTGRMLVQWVASERRRRSTIPVIFWWMSLLGASMLLAYFIWRKDIVGILGQGLGWMIYIRNLALIYGRRSAPGVADDVDPEPSLEEETG